MKRVNNLKKLIWKQKNFYPNNEIHKFKERIRIYSDQKTKLNAEIIYVLSKFFLKTSIHYKKDNGNI